MRLTPEARQRVLSLARHAAVAAGLGVGWLLLGGSSASASSDPAPPLPVSSQVLASPVTNAPVELAAPVVKPLAAALPPVSAVQQSSRQLQTVQEAVPQAQEAVPQVQESVASAVESTTTTLGSAVAAAPSVVAPVLQGPLEPLEPVVTHSASGLGQSVAQVGKAVSDTAASPAPVSLPDTQNLVPAAVPKPTAPPLTAGSADVPNPSADVQLTDAPTASAPAAVAPAVELFAGLGAVYASPDWAGLSVPAAVLQSLGTVALAPLDAPPLALPDAPPATPSDSGAGGSGGPISPVQGNASLAAEFLLAPLFILLGCIRSRRGLVPASPTFDPGSTPD
ncbi:hypothetical protein [Sinomonas terrae]|uniref:Uncharacterized protein n=1 Tax=Sinomonas terrae TaxID=2908838 RepID=A0ABS9U3J5_9MICC|nr:hypothetical protein [Sinomonas terrae]MCH6471276.1 hypothetical protein [Sinomonas terrae]